MNLRHFIFTALFAPLFTQSASAAPCSPNARTPSV